MIKAIKPLEDQVSKSPRLLDCHLNDLNFFLPEDKHVPTCSGSISCSLFAQVLLTLTSRLSHAVTPKCPPSGHLNSQSHSIRWRLDSWCPISRTRCIIEVPMPRVASQTRTTEWRRRILANTCPGPGWRSLWSKAQISSPERSDG